MILQGVRSSSVGSKDQIRLIDMSPTGRVTIGCQSSPSDFPPVPLLHTDNNKFPTEDGLSHLHLDEVWTRWQMVQDKRLSE
jgi:hypothetical protein